MNTYEFDKFCDDMLIADEGLDRFILDGFGEDTMRLYHASPLKLDIIKPTSWNVGNRLNPRARKSSFWTSDIRYSILWSLDWVVMRLNGDDTTVPFIHDINEFKFYIPEEAYIKSKRNGKETKTSLRNWMLQSLKEHPVYVYEAVIPTRIVSKGQFNIDEYTIDLPITPLKTHVIKPKDVEGILEEMELTRFRRILNSGVGDTRKQNPNIRERLIFKNPKRVIRKRTALYKKETKNYGHPDLPQELATESVIEWDQYFL